MHGMDLSPWYICNRCALTLHVRLLKQRELSLTTLTAFRVLAPNLICLTSIKEYVLSLISTYYAKAGRYRCETSRLLKIRGVEVNGRVRKGKGGTWEVRREGKL